ncbi:MAG: CoA-binding protein [Chloroflexota bacterium]|nr:CoA-binding protein [Chloroflexota bacterium]
MRDSLLKQLDYVFNPQSVAVIGASNSIGSWGFGVMSRLIDQSHRKVYPINLKASEVMGIKAYDSILEIPDPVEFAVIAVPPDRTIPMMQECVEKKIKAALVITGGLAESDELGEQLERDLVSVARKGGIRFIGPNSMGHANTSANLSTMAWMEHIEPGPVAFLSQSGTYGQRVVRTAMHSGIGFSKVVSNGNEADLHLEDYVEYLAKDKDTKVIAAYVEGLREGRRFLEVAKKITKKKPIVILKTGSTENSAKAAKSHTAALCGSDHIHDAMFKQAGVIRVQDEDELFDVISALLTIGLPRGDRVGLLTEGGGIGVVAAEACDKAGLQLPSFAPATLDKLRSLLPSRCACGNPTDMTDVITAGKLVTFPCLWAIMEDPNVDSVILLGGIGASAYFTSFMGTGSMDRVLAEDKDRFQQLINTLREEELSNMDQAKQMIAQHKKPLLFVNLMPRTMSEPESFGLLRERGIPVYSNPKRAAAVIKHLSSYHAYLKEQN